MIKPDGVQRGLIGDIIARWEKRGYKLVAMKFMTPSKEHAMKHYEDLASKPFYDDLTTFLSSGPCVPMVWEGDDVVRMSRVMLGETNPKASAPGTVRGDYSVDLGRNVMHGSDAVDTAEKEINFWFNEDELNAYKHCAHEWTYE